MLYILALKKYWASCSVSSWLSLYIYMWLLVLGTWFYEHPYFTLLKHFQATSSDNWDFPTVGGQRFIDQILGQMFLSVENSCRRNVTKHSFESVHSGWRDLENVTNNSALFPDIFLLHFNVETSKRTMWEVERISHSFNIPFIHIHRGRSSQ